MEFILRKAVFNIRQAVESIDGETSTDYNEKKILLLKCENMTRTLAYKLWYKGGVQEKSRVYFDTIIFNDGSDSNEWGWSWKKKNEKSMLYNDN